MATRWRWWIFGTHRSDGYNLLTLINHYMDVCRKEPTNLAAGQGGEATPKSCPRPSSTRMGRTCTKSIFYDAAEGVLTAVILLLAEYLPPRDRRSAARAEAHRIRVQAGAGAAGPSILPGKNEFQLLMDRLPEEHKAKWFSGSASPPPSSLWPPSCPPSSPG